MDSLRFQPAGPCDVALLAEINLQCFQNEDKSTYAGTSWSARSFAELLALPGAFGLLAVEEDAPVGFLLAQVLFDEAEVHSLGVLAPRRRAGRGRRLLEAGLAEAARRGAARVRLEVAEGNRAARALYQAVGFVPAGRRPGYYRLPDGGTQDAIVLARDLPLRRAGSGSGSGLDSGSGPETAG